MDASKWIISTRNKLKIALVLTVVAGLLLLANFFEKKQVARIDASFLSIYADRLVPATSIFEIREHLYKKQVLLQDMLHTPGSDVPAANASLASHNVKIENLLVEYKKTYFWETETRHLQTFEANLQHYNRRESQMVGHVANGDAQTARHIYQEEAAAHFDRAVQNLSELNALQSEIGKDMLLNSQKTVSGFLLLSYLELGLIFLFGALAHFLLYASRAVIQRRVDTFHMN